MARSTSKIPNRFNQAKHRLQRILKNLEVPLDSSGSLVKALMHHLNSRQPLLHGVAKRVACLNSDFHRQRAGLVLQCIRNVLAAQPTHYRISRGVLSRELLHAEQAIAIRKIMAADGGQDTAAQPTIAVPAAVSAVAPEPPAAVQVHASPVLQPTAEESASDRAAHQRCVICMDAAVQVVFMPCRHMACCNGCSDRLFSNAQARTVHWRRASMQCPVCRSNVTRRISPFVVGIE